MKTVIIDYGMGNLRSVQKAIELCGFSVEVTSDPNKIITADKIILPGVGAFNQAMENLKSKNLIEPIKQVIKEGRHFFGICLGMQLLLSSSEEYGPVAGLDIIKGSVDFFRSAAKFPKLSVPHMGWNDVSVVRENPLFKGIEQSQMYFVHSYFVNPLDKAVVIGETDYGIKFCSALQKDNLFGIQFHPEKSGKVGLKLLENFLKIS